AEKHQIIEALRQTGNNKSRAAQLLGIDRKTLYNKLKLYNISD
ncbi:MAG: helix-turn-helix domain-containing protein, partial [Bacteroides sp.]|nr:helix-turn-helix domain-containing protein [Bacteroides sp.]